MKPLRPFKKCPGCGAEREFCLQELRISIEMLFTLGVGNVRRQRGSTQEVYVRNTCSKRGCKWTGPWKQINGR